MFQAMCKILTIQKILLSSSRGLGNFRGLVASRPRTSKCVLEAMDVLEYSTFGLTHAILNVWLFCAVPSLNRKYSLYYSLLHNSSIATWHGRGSNLIYNHFSCNLWSIHFKTGNVIFSFPFFFAQCVLEN